MNPTDMKIQRNFLKTTITTRLKCPICFEVFFKPRRLFCGHTFCKPCIQELCNKQHHKNPDHVNTCPLCRTVIDFDRIEYDFLVIRIIKELQVSCPVSGCPWKGQNELLPTHYNFQCKIRQYVQNFSKEGNTTSLVVEQTGDKDDEVREKINENVQRGSLISRVISKNPHLLDFEDDGEFQFQQSRPSSRRLATRSTQTDPVKVISIHSKQYLPQSYPKFYKAPIDVSNPLIPMNGRTPIPTYVFKSNKPSLLTRIKLEKGAKPLSATEQLKDVENMYTQMGLNFYDTEPAETNGKAGSQAIDIDDL